MKKGLLSLLALALTVVGCQNYDDQFEELTSQITSLQTTVDGLTGVTATLTSLQSTVAGITSAIAALPTTDSVADLTGLVNQLNTISSTLATLQDRLANVVTADDLATISNTLGNVEADVHELLTGSSAINQDIIITTTAELDYMETVIEVGENAPSGYIVTGNVTVNHGNLSAAEITRANALTAKLITVIGAVNVDGAVDLATLAYIQGDYTVTGTDIVSVPLLANITGDVEIDGGIGVIAFDALATVGGDIDIVPAATTVSVTSVDLDGVNITGSFQSGTINFPNATSLNLGSALFTSLQAAEATDIDSSRETFGALTINTPKADTIDFDAETVGALILTTNTDTLVHFDDLDTAGAITSTEAGAQFHIPALTSTAGGAIDVVADVVNASGLVTVTAAFAADFNGSASVMLDALEDVNAALTLDAYAVINLPNANVDAAGSIISSTATIVTVQAVDDLAADVPAGTVDLTLTGHDANVVIASGSNLVDIDVTAGDDSAITFTDNSVAADDLLNIVLTDVATATFSGGNATNFTGNNLLYIDIPAASSIATATTTGDIIRFISAGTTLAEWNNTANVKDDPNVDSGEEAVTVDIAGSLLTSVNLSTVEKVRVVDLDATNSNLTEVIAPALTNLLTPGANPSFTVELSSTVTYTEATLRVADGVNPTVEFIEGHLHAPGVSTWAAYITAISVANPSPTVSIDFANVVGIENDGTTTTHADMSTAFAADAANVDTGADSRGGTADTTVNAGVISTDLELSLISATARN